MPGSPPRRQWPTGPSQQTASAAPRPGPFALSRAAAWRASALGPSATGSRTRPAARHDGFMSGSDLDRDPFSLDARHHRPAARPRGDHRWLRPHAIALHSLNNLIASPCAVLVYIGRDSLEIENILSCDPLERPLARISDWLHVLHFLFGSAPPASLSSVEVYSSLSSVLPLRRLTGRRVGDACQELVHGVEDLLHLRVREASVLSAFDGKKLVENSCAI